MPRGEHPNSRANLKPFEKGLPEKHQREVQRMGVDSASQARSLSASLRAMCTPDVMDDLNKRVLSMAKHGNLKAYEIIRDGLGEKPTERKEISTREADMHKMDGILKQLGMLDE